MESTNVIIDDSSEFYEFSTEENISSLIEEIGHETVMEQPIATPRKIRSSPSRSVATVATPETGTMKPIATKIVHEVDSKKSKGESIDVFIDPIKKKTII